MFKLLSCSLILLVVFSCTKEKIKKMDKGKYDLIHIITWDNGHKDTIHCFVYGPFGYFENSMAFYTGVENDSSGFLEIYDLEKKEKNYTQLKIKIFLPNYPPYYYGNITDCKVTKRSVSLNYTGRQVSLKGSIKINWVEL